MTTQRVLEEISREVAATAPLGQGLALELIHHTAGQGDVDPLGTGSLSDITVAGNRLMAIEPLLQLLHEILKQ